MDLLMGLLIGLGLSMAAGYRVFVPLLITSIASFMGYIELSEGFQWIGSYPALIAFSAATLIEILAFYIPWLDNLLDTVAPLFVITASTILCASQINDVNPFVSWGLGIVAGAPAGLTTQLLSSGTRITSTATTGGLGNFFVTTLENIKAFMVSIIAIVLPVLIPLFLFVVGFLAIKMVKRIRKLGISVFRKNAAKTL